MVRTSAGALAVVLAASVARASSSIPTCGAGSLCPESAPCCSQYGQCGVGAYCLGGCDPLFSHSLDSCAAAPVCNSNDFTINGVDGIVAIDDYLGDASKGNWVSTGNPLAYGSGVLLTMAESTVGTLLSSTHYVWYGKISAKLRTSQGAGVVTAFIMMSDVRDEIDFEFVGVDTANAQSNYYSQGVTDYHNEKDLGTSNTVSTEHEYTIDWQPDTLTWSIDGTVMRTLNRADTWNATANRFDYPQTPSRVMLSLWPAGLSSNAEGTITWAGGLVDWSSPYMQNGYYYASISSVSVECYDPPSGANITGKSKNSYVYNDYAGTNDTVAITDASSILASFYATGEDPELDPNAKSSASASGAASKTKSSSSQSTSAEVETVPGMSGAGNRGDSGAQASASAASGGSSGSDASAASASSLSGSNTFSQGNTDGSSGAAGREVVGGSVFAVFVAVVGLVVL